MAEGLGAGGGEGARLRLHIVAAALDTERACSASAILDISLLRAARQVVDPLPRDDRDGVGAVVLATAAAPSGAALVQAHRLAAVLSLRDAVAVPLCGLGAQGVLTAFHLSQALLRGPGARYVLVASQEAHGDGAAVFLLARSGGTPCLPLPSVAGMDGVGAALAAALDRAGVGVRSVRAVAAPARDRITAAAAAREAGLSHALRGVGVAELQKARSTEAALVAAVASPPAAHTLLWSADDAGRLGACLLESDGG